jgi:hypothetical protein
VIDDFRDQIYKWARQDVPIVGVLESTAGASLTRDSGQMNGAPAKFGMAQHHGEP